VVRPTLQQEEGSSGLSFEIELAAAAAWAAGMSWAVRGRSSSVFAPSVWRGPRDRAIVALTFDDGPSESTHRILEILARHGVPATFFQCGANVDRLPAVTREVHAAGHEIGNHSFHHPLFCFHGREFLRDDLARAQAAIAQQTGTPPAWFRAPYGVRWFGMRGVQRRLSLRGVMWSAIGYDWRLEADAIAARLVRRVSNGAILCLHDGRELRSNPDVTATVEAVRRLVPLLLDRGYGLETVSRLLCPTT
jgi:peptidoglycan/xylan/chitin deacetylase (PgdA/CDA1 family)